jgi:ferric-dicitrate binding protein FerR (iron transport regulator)
MISKEEQMRAAVAEQAVDWFLEHDERPLDTRESAALMGWYKASPINVEEFLGVAAIAHDLREAGPDSEHSVEALVAHARAADDDGRVQPLWPRAFADVSDLRVRRWQTSAVAIAALGLVSLVNCLAAGGTFEQEKAIILGSAEYFTNRGGGTADNGCRTIR